ncbi:hypothetical protein K469DRAFT_38436 [Zopfia rhizophila CBS 207.26]|uniref:Uncharacterized protein n=1 Tax=Zopfia rhizophila CBS 207.26 TaxID=1314779 RepID=A0A6A6D967_9PEZI|nr:hypothetical protein K469DRAFT_38436 [Zopfia rhizophila CBS 207.26]
MAVGPGGRWMVKKCRRCFDCATRGLGSGWSGAAEYFPVAKPMLGVLSKLPRITPASQLQLGCQSYGYEDSLHGNRATPDVCLLGLVKRQHEGKNVHKEDARHPARHPNKSSKSHLRSIQSYFESCTRHRKHISSPSSNRYGNTTPTPSPDSYCSGRSWIAQASSQTQPRLGTRGNTDPYNRSTTKRETNEAKTSAHRNLFHHS